MAIQRVYFYADDEADADVFAWLAAQGNRSEALRGMIRAAGSQAAGTAAGEDVPTMSGIRRVLREELARVAVAVSTAPPAITAEDDDLRDALDDLAATWQYEEVAS